MNSSDTAQIFFDDVRVPQRHLIGHEGQGFTYQMLQFQEERLWGAANALKGMDNAVRDTIEYTRGRKIFGRPVLDNQVVHFTLAELQTEIEALRALVYRATELYVAGQDVTPLASMAKLKAGRLTREVADKCLQYWGGMGYTWENPVSRCIATGASPPLWWCGRGHAVHPVQADGHAAQGLRDHRHGERHASERRLLVREAQPPGQAQRAVRRAGRGTRPIV
jgi:alkylation response protein AidB-like acyl-CoA dehydrogenase